MKKIISFIITLLCLNIASYAQDDAAKFAEGITAAGLKKYLTVIASDEMEGRETGTEGQRKAAEYIEAQFKALGLKPVDALNGYQQLYPLFKDSMISSELKINNTALEYGKDYIGAAGANETGSFKGKKIVFAGYGINDSNYNDYSGWM